MEKRELSIEGRVLRGLSACGTGTWDECQKCPYNGLDTELDECWELLCADAVAVIKRQALCVKILDNAVDESAVLLDELSDEVAALKRGGKEAKVPTEGGTVKKEYFSAEEVRRMTIDEVGVHREVILKSMRYWHEGSGAPTPPRSARGFLGREDI